jgi:hypothetical protein
LKNPGLPEPVEEWARFFTPLLAFLQSLKEAQGALIKQPKFDNQNDKADYSDIPFKLLGHSTK